MVKLGDRLTHEGHGATCSEKHVDEAEVGGKLCIGEPGGHEHRLGEEGQAEQSDTPKEHSEVEVELRWRQNESHEAAADQAGEHGYQPLEQEV